MITAADMQSAAQSWSTTAAQSWSTTTNVVVTPSVTPTPPPSSAPPATAVYHDIVNNIDRWQWLFRSVGQMQWVLDPGEAERLKSLGTPDSQIAEPGFGRGHWVYHGLGTVARQQVLFARAKESFPDLTAAEANAMRAEGVDDPTAYRMLLMLRALVGTSADPGDAPIGNDGAPLNYGSNTGYGNGATPVATPGGQPLGSGGTPTGGTPGPDGKGGTATIPVVKPLPASPLPMTGKNTIAVVALIAGIVYIMLG